MAIYLRERNVPKKSYKPWFITFTFDLHLLAYTWDNVYPVLSIFGRVEQKHQESFLLTV